MNDSLKSPTRRHILSSINPDEDEELSTSALPLPLAQTAQRSQGEQRRARWGSQRAQALPPATERPQAAFRESLFDAMADDEGALYWEGVYGQPVHVYSNERGELERMSDEEYAAYVRQKMWEKTHAGLMEERARQYNEAWARWDEGPTASSLPWPSKSGDQSNLDEKSVKGFFINCLKHEEKGEKGFLTKLKEERVRWHPDKIQQKLGGQVAEDTMKEVTAIFQIIDRLWSDMRDGK
ncbi:unnamed protein product [Clonostachys rosea f. rosea IK726]|uniref:Uncharacterized protein n=2 Tax=Bionectria ochroleuca TaxID=29856 RepID=A0A0B7K0K1_BIOOC|nr:unnamed protein product [Clonostachys rosea f. rosea IK726]